MKSVDRARRRVLQGCLGAGSLFLPLPYSWVWAQSEGTRKLLRAPKLALVMGNSKYRESPLKNPTNDARAIADALKATGFDVTLKVDAGKADMAAAVQAYVQALAARKSIGLFYYAGHGIQLAWKNYMLPVDADIDTIADVQKQAVAVHALMEGLTKAGNPMNVVILDACRDNPFGNLKGVDHKGLSQMDAPPQTLLAFATSPGNVASDGDGANGLYTENLLREIKVPEAKVEDVFKRVRLGVRRKSNGAQIPWESTSLEEDFWFLPPKEMRSLSDAEKEKRFDEELALWEKIKRAADAAPFEDYLRRFPSGQFAELAQLQLEQALARQGEKRIRIASAEGNPYTKGSADADTRYKVGDSYIYRRADLLTNTERQAVHIVVEVTADEVRYGSGRVSDLLGNTLRPGGGRVYTANQLEPVEYVVGKQWRTQYRITTPKGATGRSEMELRIATREPITVPAGTFNAFRIEGRGVFEDEGGGTELTTLTKWSAPDRLRREVAMQETRERFGGGLGRRVSSRITQSVRWELLSYKQS